MSSRKPQSRKVKVEVPPDLDATYANLAVISHSPSEIVIDFARALPNTPKARVHARIITTPLHAKLLLRALKDNLERYEAQFGEIAIPSSGDDLTRQFFGGVKPPDE
ncbi:MAG: DUF3467 domain-containing protein [Anaerolineae bacterium]|jgi:hypothetical protein